MVHGLLEGLGSCQHFLRIEDTLIDDIAFYPQAGYVQSLLLEMLNCPEAAAGGAAGNKRMQEKAVGLTIPSYLEVSLYDGIGDIVLLGLGENIEYEIPRKTR